jgi:hypothetical protein
LPLLPLPPPGFELTRALPTTSLLVLLLTRTRISRLTAATAQSTLSHSPTKFNDHNNLPLLFFPTRRLEQMEEAE